MKTKYAENKKSYLYGAVFFLVALLLFSMSSVSIAPAQGDYSIVARVRSRRISFRRNVPIEVSGGSLTEPVTKQTNRRGFARFNSLEPGTYTVVPGREGFRFVPVSRLVTLNGDQFRKRVVFRPVRLPAVSTLTADPIVLSVRDAQVKTVTVTVKDAAGIGIEGAPVGAVIANPAIALVEPAAADTDSNGRAVFSVIGGSRIESPPAGVMPLALGVTTITFSSGGWRETEIKSAVVSLTIETGLPVELWLTSGHGDASSEAFRHWDEDDPPEVPTSCARCHSKPGFLDYAADGVVDDPAPIDTVIDCFLCHDPVAWALDSVEFPSGAVITDLGYDAICMTCHQGRASALTVDEEIVDAGSPAEDEVDPDIGFVNIHYYAAAATLYGTDAMGGYEYAGKEYDRRTPHVSSFNVCYECHNPHSLVLKLNLCTECHAGVTDYTSLGNIRMAASTEDYNGNGLINEGIKSEIAGLADGLYAAMQVYAAGNGFPIVYDTHSYPYFFNDTNGNGVGDPDELVRANGYSSWTPRLLKAGYNYHLYLKDPGGFGHNPKYIIQLLYDSADDLGADMTGLARNDLKHFDTTREAFRHWDEDDPPVVEADCTRCHAGEAGFLYYLNNNFTESPDPMEPVSRFSCETCHTGVDFAGAAPRRYVSKVIFPGGTEILNDPVSPDQSFICMTCHQGRESTITIDAAVLGLPEDDIDPALTFLNIHYLSAGATIYGSLAHVGYEYPGKVYAIRFTHWGLDSAECNYCHDLRGNYHSFEPRLVSVCLGCHTEATPGDIETVRLDRLNDYDGDGNNTEPLFEEIDTLRAALYAALQAYAASNMAPVIYEGATYPYFFNDTNGNGQVDPGEASYPNRYQSWTPRLLKAAHNFQMSLKEPGNWAHNTNYTAQCLIDSIEDLGGDVSSFQRPVGF